MFIYIRSMSEARSKVHDQIASVAYEMDRHIMKLMLYPDTEYVEHWEKEIAGFLNHVPKMKGSNKYPSAKFIIDAVSIYEDAIEDMLPVLKEDYSRLHAADVTLADIEHVIAQYHKWLSTALAEKGQVSQVAIINKLHELIL